LTVHKEDLERRLQESKKEEATLNKRVAKLLANVDDLNEKIEELELKLKNL